MAGAHRRFNITVEDKFPFQSKGSFKVSYGLEYFFMAAIALAFVAGLIGILTGVPLLFRADPNATEPKWGLADPNNTDWHLFAAFVELAAIAVLGSICAFAFNVVIKGKAAHYDADSYRFCVTEDREKEVFFYSEVTAVTYDPIMFLGRIRGYTVQIRTTKGARLYTYRVVLNKMQLTPNPDATPFIILEENAGLRQAGQSTVYAREEEFMKSATVGGMSAPDLPLPSQTSHSITDNMTDEEYLQYLRTHASEVREINRSHENTPSAVNTDDMTDEEYSAYLKAKRAAAPSIPEISRPSTLSHGISGSVMPSVSLEKARNNEEMPAISLEETKSGEAAVSLEKTSGAPRLSPTVEDVTAPAVHHNPRFKNREDVKRGQFRIPFRFERPIKLGIIAIAVLGLIDCGIDNLGAIFGSSTMPMLSFVLEHVGFFLLFGVLWCGMAVLFIKVVEIGRDIKYEADSTKFVLYDNRDTVVIKYEDLISVKFYPMNRGFVQRGWNVSIVTAVNTYSYSYFFPTGKEYVHESETPFHYLTDNIPEK